MELSGKIRNFTDDIQVSDAFKKRELVITTNEQYEQNILIEFQQDKCEYLDSYKVGDNITVHINLRGRIWVNPQGEEKCFNQILGWKIEKIQ